MQLRSGWEKLIDHKQLKWSTPGKWPMAYTFFPPHTLEGSHNFDDVGKDTQHIFFEVLEFCIFFSLLFLWGCFVWLYRVSCSNPEQRELCNC